MMPMPQVEAAAVKDLFIASIGTINHSIYSSDLSKVPHITQEIEQAFQQIKAQPGDEDSFLKFIKKYRKNLSQVDIYDYKTEFYTQRSDYLLSHAIRKPLEGQLLFEAYQKDFRKADLDPDDDSGKKFFKDIVNGLKDSKNPNYKESLKLWGNMIRQTHNERGLTPFYQDPEKTLPGHPNTLLRKEQKLLNQVEKAMSDPLSPESEFIMKKYERYMKSTSHPKNEVLRLTLGRYEKRKDLAREDNLDKLKAKLAFKNPLSKDASFFIYNYYLQMVKAGLYEEANILFKDFLVLVEKEQKKNIPLTISHDQLMILY